jgi:malate permease and related proteins
MIVTKLLQIYLPLVSAVTIGWVSRRWLPAQTPFYLGKSLFWVGVPISVFVFLRRTDWSGSVWLAGGVAWAVMLTGLGLMYYTLHHGRHGWRQVDRPTQGTALLATMLGNTGYLGFPIVLTLYGDAGFVWALFYDLLGTTLGAYGAGAVIARRYGATERSGWAIVQTGWANPTIGAFVLGLGYRQPLPEPIEAGLAIVAWGSIALALLLIGLRLGQLTSLHQLRQTRWPLALKMLLLPLMVWVICGVLPIPPIAKQVLVLQAAMPPAFATVVLTEQYQLDPELAVAVVAGGTILLLFTLPLWTWLTGSG